ncbi:aminopeptidase NAALADL1 [Ictalurus punctatus]|uniref:Aminopeptidase NAALADL1 n=1 Tax=Ictalurus punctatus TaxID=7998 RepID=A0A2D0PNP0_ICTPU|nr:aminopeptidase NAALADL1 [Ictalurus punctatus]
MLKKVLLFALGGAAVFTVGILIGHFGIKKNTSAPLPEWVHEVAQDVDENLVEKFIAQVDTTQIRENLQALTRVPHMATTAGDEATVEYMLKRWQDKDTGLDAAWREDYRVYLSFPDKDKPNNVTVVRGSEVLASIREKEKAYYPEQNDPDVVQPYAAFGPAGHAKGKLVYANQGKVTDYVHLNNTLGSLNGTIAIVRYGGAGRADKGFNAAPFGVVGVLVYTDPYDINDGKMSDESETYPHSWYLPPSGVERGSYKTKFGDQLTPYLAAKNGTYRIEEKDITGVSPIPIQPIGFEDAMNLICELGGSEAPETWQGSFLCKYNFGGPGFKDTSRFKDCDVQLDVYNKAELRDSANVMGVIWGSVEPDRYVIYGNHRDSWVHGAVDPSSGTAVMLEITRILGQLVKTGQWRPRRTVIFGSWGAEEFGLIGSAEYAEEYISKLSQRTVAYINVDISVFANATLSASASPVAQHVIFAASKQVKIPGSDTVSVYDNWMQHSNRSSPTYGLIPRMGYLTGAGSDYAAFMHYLGISSMDISYTYDRSKTRARIYPAYHTAYDTFDYVDKFIDPGFTSHQTVARTAGNVLLRLADSILLPFKSSDYAETLEQYLSVAVENFDAELTANDISMEPLKEAVKSFRSAARSLEETISSSDVVSNSPLKARRINDQLMLLDRAFLNPLAFPDKYGFRHVIWASRSSGLATFPGLGDAVMEARTSGLKQDWAQAHKHLSIVTQAISGAAHTLVEAHAAL